MKNSKRLSRMMLFTVLFSPEKVVRRTWSERFLPCSCCTFFATGMVKAIHQTAVMMKAIFMPSAASMPKLEPPSTTAKQAMKGMHEPM